MDAKQPLVLATTNQIRALHAIGRRRGLSHEELRELCGVKSLKQLSFQDAATIINRWQFDDHRKPGGYEPPPPDRASERGAIRLASKRQRHNIALLFDSIGWGPEKAHEWLKEEHGIRDLAEGVFSTRAGRDIINQLEAIALKQSRQADREITGGRAGHDIPAR